MIGMREITGLRRLAHMLAIVLVGAVAVPSTASSQSQRWHDAYDEAVRHYKSEDLATTLKHARQARKLVELAAPKHADDLAKCLNLEAAILTRLGRNTESEPLLQTALKFREKNLQPDDQRIAESLNNLADLRARSGQYKNAEILHKRALAIREKAFGIHNAVVAQSLNNLANVQLALGHPEKAGPLLRRAVAILSMCQDRPLYRKDADLPDFGQSDPEAAILHVGKSGLVMRRTIHPALRTMGGRPRAAMPPGPIPGTRGSPDRRSPGDVAPPAAASGPTASSTLDGEQRRSAHEADLAVSLVNLGMMAQMVDSGPQRGEADRYYRRAIEIQEKILGPNHAELAASLNNLGELRAIQHKYADAEQLHKKALTIREKSLGPTDPQVAFSLTNLARLYSATRRPTEAIPLLQRAIAISSSVLGNTHPDVALSLRSLALANTAVGDDRQALALHRKATKSVLNHALSFDTGHSHADPDIVRASQGRLDYHFQSHVAALYRAAVIGAGSPDTIEAEAFELAQRLGHSAAARALTQMAARFGRGPGALAKMMRRQQDLVTAWRSLDDRLLSAVSALADKRDNQLIATLRRSLNALEQKIDSLTAAIRRKFPDFTNLARPAPVSIVELQKMLRPDEALVQFHLGSYGSYSWLITRTERKWTRLKLNRGAISNIVAALRCGLDHQEWYGFAGEACRQRLKTDYHSGDFEKSKPLPFDLTLAHQLYRVLFAGFEDAIKGKRLLIVPSGALTQIPLHLLVTQKVDQEIPLDVGDYAKAPLMIQRHAMNVLPSAASLKALRRIVTPSRAEHPFIGFGNPLITGQNGTDRRAFSRQSYNVRAPKTPLGKTASRAAPQSPASLIHDGVGDVGALRRQTPLPETAD